MENLTKLRPHLKLSLADIHRTVLRSLIERGPAVVRLVTRIHLEENITHRGGRPEGIKLLVQLLSTLEDGSLTGRNRMYTPPSHKCRHSVAVCGVFSELTQKSFHRFEFVSRVLGQTIHDILDSTRLDATGFKTLHEDVLRIIRSIGVLSICPALLVSEMLGTSSLTDTSSTPLQTLPSPAAVDFFGDFSLSLLLLFANAIVLMDKTKPSGDTTSGAAVDSSTGSAAVAGSTTGGLRGGKGGSLRGGRQGNIRGSGLSSSGGGMFRSTASGLKGRGGAGRGMVGGNSAPPSSAAQQTVSGVGSSGVGCAQIPGHDSVARDRDLSDGSVSTVDIAAIERTRIAKDFIHSQCAVIREVCLGWFVRYARSLFIQKTRSEFGSSFSAVSDGMIESGEDGGIGLMPGSLSLSRRRSDSAVSVDSNSGGDGPHISSTPVETNTRIASLIDWLQKVLCIHTVNSLRVCLFTNKSICLFMS